MTISIDRLAVAIRFSGVGEPCEGGWQDGAEVHCGDVAMYQVVDEENVTRKMCRDHTIAVLRGLLV